MPKGNPHPNKPPPPFGNIRARKGNVNMVKYAIRIDPATVELIKELQAMLGLKSQGEVITMAVKLLAKGK